MINLHITDTKFLMGKLFKSDMFDNLFVSHVELNTFMNITFDSTYEPCQWQTLRPYVHQLVKGAKTPKSLKIVFYLAKEKGETLAVGHDFFLNLYFQDGELSFTTGTSSKTFTLDKGHEHIWEDSVRKFFKKHTVEFTLLE